MAAAIYWGFPGGKGGSIVQDLQARQDNIRVRWACFKLTFKKTEEK